MVALDKRVTRTVAAAACDERAPEGLGIGIHLDGARYLAVLIVVGSAAELARRLGADGEHERLLRVGTEVQTLVVKPCARGDEVVIVVVVVLEPLVVKLAEVAELAVKLHPPLGKRDILVVDETSPKSHRRTGVAAPHEVAAAASIIDDGRGFVGLPHNNLDAAVFSPDIGLLEPYPGRMLLLYLKLSVTLITLIASAGSIAASGVQSGSPGETLTLVPIFGYVSIDQSRILLGNGTAIVGGDIVRRQLAVDCIHDGPHSIEAVVIGMIKSIDRGIITDGVG